MPLTRMVIDGGDDQSSRRLDHRLVTALLVVGIRESARVNNFIVAVKLAVIALFIACTVPSFNTANWVTSGNPAGDFIPPNAGIGIYGWSGIVRGAAVVFFAYIGFDAVSTAAQEARSRCGTCRSAYWARWSICRVLYVAVGFVLTGIVPFDRLNVPIRSRSASMRPVSAGFRR